MRCSFFSIFYNVFSQLFIKFLYTFCVAKTLLFSSPTPKICITVERDGKINRLIRFDERGFDCSSHVIFDYTGANFEPYPLSFLNFYGIMAVTNVVFWMILSCRLDDKYWFDHTFDHLRLRTVRTRCDGMYEKGFCSDTKAPKNMKKPWFYKHFCIRDQEVARSNRVTPTISSVHNRFQLWTLDIFYVCIYISLFGVAFCYSFSFRLR